MTPRRIVTIPAWPLAGLLVVLALQITLVTGRAVNWDEFFHYSQIHNLASGTLTGPLQTLYTRAFLWVIALPGNSIDHIVTIRWFMLACELVTLAAIIGMGRRFAGPPAAWLAALAYLSAGYVFQHGTSFRFDPPAAALLMSAAWIMLCRPLRAGWIALTGLLLGIATVLTIKSVLYASVFAGVAWLRWHDAGRSLSAGIRLVAYGVAAAAGCLLVYGLHASALPEQSIIAAQATVDQNGGKMFSLLGQPYWLHHLKGAALAPFVTILALLFPFVLVSSSRPAAEKVALAGLFLPLATLLFYHNTAPYYFVFMLAPVCVALAVVMDLAVQRYGPRLLSVMLAALALAIWWIEQPGVIERQRLIVTTAETAFPDKPAYFDACAMLGSLPKANVFMTPVGIALYRDGHYPAFADVMARRAVPLVVEDDPILTKALTGTGPVPELLPGDVVALRDSYVHFWGPFWLAGQKIDKPKRFALRIPGRYRVEGGELTLDGGTLKAGTIVELARGEHQAVPAAGASVRLIWAAAKLPQGTQPAPPLFVDF